MQTPAGKECRYFYGDYYRGREHEECRLLLDTTDVWFPELCSKCPVPDILLANACEHMRFDPSLRRPFFILRPEIHIDTYCSKCQCDVNEPRIGCGQCHQLPDSFIVAPNDPDTSA